MRSVMWRPAGAGRRAPGLHAARWPSLHPVGGEALRLDAALPADLAGPGGALPWLAALSAARLATNGEKPRRLSPGETPGRAGGAERGHRRGRGRNPGTVSSITAGTQTAFRNATSQPGPPASFRTIVRPGIRSGGPRGTPQNAASRRDRPGDSDDCHEHTDAKRILEAALLCAQQPCRWPTCAPCSPTNSRPTRARRARRTAGRLAGRGVDSSRWPAAGASRAARDARVPRPAAS